MEPMLEYLPKDTDESFVVKFFDYNYFPTPWHFHPEYELVLVVESTGTKLIGDNISSFSPGDLLLLGPYLPHTYTNGEEYLKENSVLRAKSIVVHFGHDVFGTGFFALPEVYKIRELLARSQHGLSVEGNTNLEITSKLYLLTQAKGYSRLSILMDILHTLSVSDGLRNLNANPVMGYNETEARRMQIVFDFVGKNFDRTFTVAEIARLLGLTQNSFSRYFTQRTRKPFTIFVNEVRLKHASKLLIETTKPVTEIALESGFANLSNFNRQFRLFYKTNPLAYRKVYKQGND